MNSVEEPPVSGNQVGLTPHWSSFVASFVLSFVDNIGKSDRACDKARDKVPVNRAGAPLQRFFSGIVYYGPTPIAHTVLWQGQFLAEA